MADTQLQQLVINELTKAQYEALTPAANQLYLVTDEVPLDSSVITTTIASSSTNNQVPGALATYTALNNKVDKNNAIDGATHTKITYDSKGLVTGGTDLSATDIPSLDASKITTGTFVDARIASANTWNNKTSINDSSTSSTIYTWSASKLYNYVDYMTASDVDTIWAEVIG